jgi:DNA polymerase-4
MAWGRKSGLRWLYVDFNSYFASVEQELRPELRGRPVVVVPVETDSTCAIAASYEAKAFGVRTGTPVWEARQKCPGLVCVLARHDCYVDFHHRILAEVDRHIPVTDVCSIDEVACRLMDNETGEDVATRIALSIKAGLAARVGAFVRCSVGIAPNRYLAKVATDLQKPDGLTILRGEELPGRLLTLAPADLPGIGRNMDRRLGQAGVHDMAGLWALSPRQMREIWGSSWGPRMWQLLRGEDLPEIETQRRSIGHSHVMAPALRDPAAAVFVARRLLLKAVSRLRRMDFCAGGLDFSARLEDGTKVKAAARCRPAQDSMVFLRMLDGIWRDTVDGRRIKKLGVTLHQLLPVADVQPDLLDLPDVPAMAARRRDETLSRVMDRLNQRFGRDTVLLGMTPAQGKSFSGTEVAFTRIPDMREFSE